MSASPFCPQCGEPLLVYAADAGRYLGCPECLWMGEPELPQDGDPEALADVLDAVSDEEPPGWMLRDLDEPPTNIKD